MIRRISAVSALAALALVGWAYTNRAIGMPVAADAQATNLGTCDRSSTPPTVPVAMPKPEKIKCQCPSSGEQTICHTACGLYLSKDQCTSHRCTIDNNGDDDCDDEGEDPSCTWSE